MLFFPTLLYVAGRVTYFNSFAKPHSTDKTRTSRFLAHHFRKSGQNMNTEETVTSPPTAETGKEDR